jgi:DNA-binding transcriptional regulator YiaG
MDAEFEFKNPFYRKWNGDLKTVGDHIKKRRIELGMLQKEVAATLNVSEDTVTFWENNRVKPMINHIPTIIKFLGYDPLPIERKTLGGKIKYYRYINGLSHKAFGKLLHVNASTIGSWETNEFVPKPATFKKLLNFIQEK